MRLALFGPPGAETGGVADYLADRLGLARISLHDAVQSATRARSELARQLRQFMDAEQAPPDELVAELMLRRLGEPDAAGGFVFLANDAKVALLLVRSLDPLTIQVVELALATTEATRRLTGRRRCRDCGKGWHVESAPSLDADTCDRCGGGLFQRQDDAPDAVVRRLGDYRERSSLALALLHETGRLISIDAARPAKEIAFDLAGKIDRRR
jgi:adenylate kinase